MCLTNHGPFSHFSKFKRVPYIFAAGVRKSASLHFILKCIMTSAYYDKETMKISLSNGLAYVKTKPNLVDNTINYGDILALIIQNQKIPICLQTIFVQCVTIFQRGK